LHLLGITQLRKVTMPQSNPAQNGICPSLMTDEERFAELGRILAAGIMRMHRKSSTLSANQRDSSLDIQDVRSVILRRAKTRRNGGK